MADPLVSRRQSVAVALIGGAGYGAQAEVMIGQLLAEARWAPRSRLPAGTSGANLIEWQEGYAGDSRPSGRRARFRDGGHALRNRG